MPKQVLFNDGSVSIGIERSGGTIRLFPKVYTEGNPADHIGLVSFDRWTERCVFLHAAFGAMPMRHQALIVRSLRQAGFRWMLAKRIDGRIGLGEIVPYGPLDDCMIVDLEEAAQRALQRYPAKYDPAEGLPCP